MGSYMAKKGETPRGWHVVDAAGKAPGRLATRIARVLMGKHRPTWTPHVDTGEFVIVINAEKIKVTGNKLEEKMYYNHSQYPGGLKERTLKELLEKKPEEVIKRAVWGMIPKNKLGRAVVKKLKVYKGPVHPHEAQNPREFQV